MRVHFREATCEFISFRKNESRYALCDKRRIGSRCRTPGGWSRRHQSWRRRARLRHTGPHQKAAIQAIHDGHTKYTAIDGTSQLKAAIQRKFERDNQLAYAPEQILVS